MNSKPCEICGKTERTFFFSEINMQVCQRHYGQYKNHGKIFDRTIYDKNDIENKGETSEIILRDRDQNETGRAITDTKFVDVVKNYKWYLNNGGYAVSGAYPDHIFLHKLITGASDLQQVDHKDRVRLNCTEDNLRICTSDENAINHSLRKDNKSGYSGITFNKTNNKFRVKITVNKKQIHLGYYSTFEEAVEVRKQAQTKYFKEFNPNT